MPQSYANDAGLFIRGVDLDVDPSRKRLHANEVRASSPEVVFAFGQSNAGNHGHGSYRPRRAVYCYNPLDDGFYLAEDPIPGATGEGGSPWPRLGDLLIERGAAKSLLFVSIAVGGSYLVDWAPGGQFARRLVFGLERCKRVGLRIERMLWSQGEAEANLTDMPRDAYKKQFLAMFASVRRAGIDAPIWVARSTFCATEAHPYDNRDEIRRAQAELVDRELGIHAGPDTDLIGLEGRIDGCHFNEWGLQRAAELWAEAIANDR